MRFEGTLSQWNDDRGFGFITPQQGTQLIFVHISAFPKDGQRPTPGEKLTFEIETDNNGKKRAKNLLCLQRTKVQHTPLINRLSPYQRSESPFPLKRFLLILILIGVVAYNYGENSRQTISPPTAASPPETQNNPSIQPHIYDSPTTVPEPKAEADSSAYRCDGRIYCSQMTSCAEAKYFLNNCPNVQMDGDYDGEPCEEQLCSPFAQ